MMNGDDIRKYEAVGSIIDALQRFDNGIRSGEIDEDDDLHGKEIDALQRFLEMKNQDGNFFYAIVNAYKMGYMHRYDKERD